MMVDSTSSAPDLSVMTPLLAVANVRKQFATVTAVDDVSLTVRRGEIFALLGPNGAGKTTLLRMMLGLLLPDSGTITATGGAHRKNGRLDARQVGYLPEDRGLYPDVPVLRTLVYFGALRGMDRRAAAVAAEEWLERMSLADRAGEPLKSLSKGNQQKIQFISSVLHRPAFAVLDEPFSGLDPVNQDFFLSLIRELRDGGMTVVLSAHQMQLVERIADRLMVLNRGRVILSGTLDEIRRRWTTGSRLVVRYSGAVPADLLTGQLTGATVQQVDDSSLTVFVPEGEPLGPVLSELGARVDVRGIESHAVTLHDVYVSAIGLENNHQPELAS